MLLKRFTERLHTLSGLIPVSLLYEWCTKMSDIRIVCGNCVHYKRRKPDYVECFPVDAVEYGDCCFPIPLVVDEYCTGVSFNFDATECCCFALKKDNNKNA